MKRKITSKIKKAGTILSALLLVFAMCAGCTNAQENAGDSPETQAPVQTEAATEPVKDWTWPTDTPENQGIDPAVLEDVHDTFDSFTLLASVIVRNGRIVDEYYKDGYDSSTSFLLHSASKSVTSALIGIAIGKGFLESVDTPIAEYFPQLREKDDPRWQQITIRHLLTHTPGIDCGDTEFEDTWRASDNWIEFALNRPITSDPGTVFNYSTSNTHMLCAIIQEATDMTAYEFGKKYLFDPMGMDSVTCGTDAQGISDGGNGISMDIYDWAKFGQLYLNGGQWQGQQLVPREWVEASTSLQFKRSTGSADYGYQWWVRTFGDAGYDAYFAQGHAGQYLFVVPDLQLVIAFTGDYTGRTSIYWQLANQIVNACQA